MNARDSNRHYSLSQRETEGIIIPAMRDDAVVCREDEQGSFCKFGTKRDALVLIDMTQVRGTALNNPLCLFEIINAFKFYSGINSQK